MAFRNLKPMLRTWDLEETVAFYTNLLGFACDALDQEWGWAQLSRDGIAVMLSGPNSHEGDQSPSWTGSLYFTLDDVESLWQSLQGQVRVCYPPADFPYGMREFAIYDNNGYLLQFGQPLPLQNQSGG